MKGAYWDARDAAEALREEPLWISYYNRFQNVGPLEGYLKGRWADRNWLNVPGPFYGAETDSCAAGIGQAPGHVLIDERGQEFVWRQPQNEEELRNVLSAAYQDPFDGYAWDGDDHWTSGLVQDWWNQRERVKDWIDQALEVPLRNQHDALQSSGLNAFRDYLDRDLEHHLDGYIVWLDRSSSSPSSKESS
jgi:hypothetical protein